MGSETTYPIKIFCFGNKDEILQNIFPKKDELYNDQWENRYLKHKEFFTDNEKKETISATIEWKATLYPNITDDNVNELFDDLTKKMDIPTDDYDDKQKDKNDPKAREKTKNIIIKFGKENSYYIINYMNDIPKTHLPQIAIITNEDFNAKEEGLKDNRYLSIIKYKNNNSDEIQKKIFEYLWEKECYYNERGTVTLDLPDKIETNNYINIMLTGMSRSGKSTLINVLSEKLVTLESPFLESVTNKIREYKVITSENGEFLTGLRFFDTPGLTIIKKKKIFGDRNTIKEVKDAIDSKIKENEDSRDDIHLIYFMLKGYNNLEYYVDFFEYIIEINKDRFKRGKQKIYMIFIFNQGNDSSESALIQFLKDNNLYDDLIEKTDASKEKKEKINFKEKYKNKKSNKNNPNPKYNIVLLNLLKDEEKGINVFGIDTLLQLTLDFVKKHNPFFEKNFNFDKLKDYEKMLKDSNINKNDRIEIENNVKKIYKDLSEENSFFSNIRTIDSIIANAHFHNMIFIAKAKLFRTLLFIFFWRKKNISEYINTFKKIEHNYKIYTNDIMLKPIMNNGDIKTFKWFELVKISNESDHEKKEIIDNLKLLEDSKENYKVCLKINNQTYEGINPFPEIIHNNSFYRLLVDYFDNYLKETCCINYILKQKEIYDNIFKQLDKMIKKKDWDNFHPLIYK